MAVTSTPLAVIADRLGALGCKKRAGAVFTYEVDGDVLGWLGLNTATRHLEPGQIEVNPVVGIRNQEVERIVAELRGEKFHAYQPPTVSTSLGYLMPGSRYRAWVMSASTAETESTDLAQAVVDFGRPFVDSGSSLPELCRLLDRGLVFEHQLVYRRPVAWLMAGDRARSHDLLAAAEAELGDRTDAAAEEFRSFSTAFRARFGVRSSG